MRKVSLFLVFGLVILVSLINITPKKVLASSSCLSYYTCHYQSNPRLQCRGEGYDAYPFRECLCRVNTSTGECKKVVYNVCWNQKDCNNYMGYWQNPIMPGVDEIPCPQYGDCCGCSGKPRPIPKPTARPTPTPTIIPKPGTKNCYQACRLNSECQKGLTCGYNVQWGERRCHNASCPLKVDCSCNW